MKSRSTCSPFTIKASQWFAYNMKNDKYLSSRSLLTRPSLQTRPREIAYPCFIIKPPVGLPLKTFDCVQKMSRSQNFAVICYMKVQKMEKFRNKKIQTNIFRTQRKSCCFSILSFQGRSVEKVCLAVKCPIVSSGIAVVFFTQYRNKRARKKQHTDLNKYCTSTGEAQKTFLGQICNLTRSGL